MTLADSDSLCYLSHCNLTFPVMNCHIPDSLSYITGQTGRVFIKGKQGILIFLFFLARPENFFPGPQNGRLQLPVLKRL